MAVLVCWLLVVFDGYDLIVYGTVQSSLLAEPGWGLSAASLGTVGSMAFIGMMIGALFAGRIADSLGATSDHSGLFHHFLSPYDRLCLRP